MSAEDRPLVDTVYSKLDRKATAIFEFTMRQYRTRLSTWATLGVGALILMIVMLFYIEGMTETIEAVDNDGDSFDSDNDGYVDGQELLLGTGINNPDDHPGLLNPPVPPDPPEKWINEDDFDVKSIANSASHGNDDDGDCQVRVGQIGFDDYTDDNNNGIDCDIEIRDSFNRYIIDKDPNVDEDPDEDAYYKETVHRGFILGFGKIGFVFVLGIFLPLFLATGLIRDEMSGGTLHYIVAKPISRAEVLTYRLLGYIGLTWPYFAILTIISAIITGLMGPGEGFFRFADLFLWFGIFIATILLSTAYAAIFMTMGVIHKYGMIGAIVFGVWEFSMAITSVFSPETTVTQLSLARWGMIIVDGFANITWPDSQLLVALGQSVTVTNWDFGFSYESSLEGADILEGFAHRTPLTGDPIVDILISCTLLFTITVLTIIICQSIFKGKEID